MWILQKWHALFQTFFLIFKLYSQYPLCCSVTSKSLYKDCFVHENTSWFTSFLECTFTYVHGAGSFFCTLSCPSSALSNQSLIKSSITWRFSTGWLYLVANSLLIFCKFSIQNVLVIISYEFNAKIWNSFPLFAGFAIFDENSAV